MTIYHPYIDDQGARQRRNAVTHPDALWPNGIVPYEISSQFSGKGTNFSKLDKENRLFTVPF